MRQPLFGQQKRMTSKSLSSKRWTTFVTFGDKKSLPADARVGGALFDTAPLRADPASRCVPRAPCGPDQATLPPPRKTIASSTQANLRKLPQLEAIGGKGSDAFGELFGGHGIFVQSPAEKTFSSKVTFEILAFGRALRTQFTGKLALSLFAVHPGVMG